MDQFLARFQSYTKLAPPPLALVEGGRTYTYSDLDRLSDALAITLTEAGLTAGDHIGCLKTKMVSAYVTVLAGIKTGIVFLNLDARESEARISHVFGATNIKRLLIDSDKTEADFDQKYEYPIIRLDQLKPDGRSFSVPDIPRSDPFWLEPTSGSTGAPKLVQSPRETISHLIFSQANAAGFTHKDRIALFGEMWCDTLLAGLCVGACYHSYDLKEQGTAPLPQWMRENKITALQTYVAAFRGLAESAIKPLNALMKVRISGEVILRRDVELFEHLTQPGAELMNFYGSTECGLISQFVHRHGDPVEYDILPIGKEIRGSEIEIVYEDMTVAPDGVTGLMLNRSRHLADGYYQNPEKTKETYWEASDGFRVLNTGDLAFRDGDGNVHVVGRADDQVKIRGFSVRYSEVETLLQEHHAISSVAVTSFLSPRGQRQLSAHIILAENCDWNPAEMKSWLASRAPAYLVPGYYVQHQEFPRTDSGKIQRRALPNPLDIQDVETANRGHLTGTQSQVLSAWSEILGHDGFGLDEDFFDCGGDSLQAMSMVVALERTFSVRIGYESLIMEGATIRSISERIEKSKHDVSRILNLKTGDGKMPLYILPVENGEFSNWLYMLERFSDDITLLGVHVRDLTKRSSFPRLKQQDLAKYAAESIVQNDPEGPYFIAGYSAGTQTAFETARCLLDMGKDVAGLILLDPPVLRLEEYRKFWRARRILSPLKNGLDFAEAINRVGHIYFRRPAKQLHVADETTFWSYQPKPCSLPSTLLVSAEVFNPNRDEKEQEWSTLVGGNPDIALSPGAHDTITREPNASVLANIVETWWRNNRELHLTVKQTS